MLVGLECRPRQGPPGSAAAACGRDRGRPAPGTTPPYSACMLHLAVQAMGQQPGLRRRRRRRRSHRRRFRCPVLSSDHDSEGKSELARAPGIAGQPSALLLIFARRLITLPRSSTARLALDARPGRRSRHGSPGQDYDIRGSDAERSRPRKRVFRCRPAALQARLRKGRGPDRAAAARILREADAGTETQEGRGREAPHEARHPRRQRRPRRPRRPRLY